MLSTTSRAPTTLAVIVAISFLGVTAFGAAPAAPQMVDFPMTWTPDAIGAFDAAGLLDKPAGRRGPVIVKGDHFYTGDQRIRFWGVNICFAAAFPTHEQADRMAARLGHFGVNAVRFHHMDNQKFPRGIFADDKCETLSPEALDRLDYFISALKKNGIYSNINLHVSRTWSKAHQFPDADQLIEHFDKVIDIFHPEIIEANKKYARDLLSHVNKYTGQPYASEPAVCMVEINNENTLFLWSGQRVLANLPDPYAALLGKLWNQWLVKKHGSRDKLAAAWNTAATPLGENLLKGRWQTEMHNGAKMTVAAEAGTLRFDISKLSGTEWHLQYSHPGLKLRKGEFYTVTFTASAGAQRALGVGVAQAHEPWNNLGLTALAKLSKETKPYRFGFVATADDDNGRISFSLGQATGSVIIKDVQLRTGGQEGLRDDEDPAAGTVRQLDNGVSETPARAQDWYSFLQQTDENYFVDMRRFLKEELKLQAPVTGTIGLGPLNTLGQSRMDFVDAHSYWDHPHFPGRPWDPHNWRISNAPMVDNPRSATLWRLAAIRVAGKPFTVTEYNHGHPNQWQAECMPLIATFAAQQDWDGIFIFSYSHSEQIEKNFSNSYFDIEANPLKMLAMPVAARLFQGQGLQPHSGAHTLSVQLGQVWPNAAQTYHDMWKLMQLTGQDSWEAVLKNRTVTVFQSDGTPIVKPASAGSSAVNWTSEGKGTFTGRYVVADPKAATFIGFAGAGAPIDMGEVKLQQLASPFAAITVVPADPSKSIRDSDRLLLCAMARAENSGMVWNADRTMVTNWGKAPTRIEVVNATLQLPADYTVKALDSSGKVLSQTQTQGKVLRLGDCRTLWYELVRR